MIEISPKATVSIKKYAHREQEIIPDQKSYHLTIKSYIIGHT